MSEQVSHSQSIPEIHNRPMGPLEEGDQAIIDAIDDLPEASFEPPLKEGFITGERRYAKGYSHLSNEVDGGVRFVSASQSNPKRNPLSRKSHGEIAQVKMNDGLIMAETRDFSGGPSDDVSYSKATWNNMVESGQFGANGVIREPARMSRTEHQAIKKEAARRIEATKHRLGKAGVKLSAQ